MAGCSSAISPIQVGQRPDVFEGCAGSGVAHQRSVVPVGVERRVQANEVNRGGVEAAQDVQVVPGLDGSVGCPPFSTTPPLVMVRDSVSAKQLDDVGYALQTEPKYHQDGTNKP